MATKKKIQINVSTQSFSKLAGLVANTALLLSNAFLVGTSLQEQLRDRRRQRIAANLQGAAVISAALASLARVISETLEQHRGPGS